MTENPLEQLFATEIILWNIAESDELCKDCKFEIGEMASKIHEILEKHYYYNNRKEPACHPAKKTI